MNLTIFFRGAAFALYLLSSGSLFAAHQSDDLSFTRAPTRRAFLIADENPTQPPAQRAFLIANEDPTQQGTAHQGFHQDPLLSAFEKQRDETLGRAKQAEETVAQQARTLQALKKLVQEKNEAEKKTQEAEATAADQARQIEALMALLNPSAKPQPVPQVSQASFATFTPVKASASAASSSAAASTPVPRPIVSDIAIPEIARGYEDIYRRFLGGKLIYTDPTSKAKRELPIRALANPLEGTFDLSGCGDTGQYLSISTGYRKGVKAENKSKVEIWLAPWFLVNKNLSSSANHLQPIMGNWDAAAAPVGLFWTWGGYNNLDWYEYLVTNSFSVMGSEDLYEKYKRHTPPRAHDVLIVSSRRLFSRYPLVFRTAHFMFRF